jgi:hypothetical protein
LVISLSISSKPSCNVASGSRFDIDSIEPESLELILATEKEPIDIQEVGDAAILVPVAAGLAVLPVNYSSGGTRLDLELERRFILLFLPDTSGGGM